MKYQQIRLLSEGTDEASIIQTALKMARMYPLLNKAMETLINASKINQITVKQQANKWLSHPTSNYRKNAAMLVDNIQMDDENELTSGVTELMPVTYRLVYDLDRYMRQVLSNDELQALYELPLRAAEQRLNWDDMAQIWQKNPPSVAHRIIAMSYRSWTNTNFFRAIINEIINAED